LKTTIGKVLTRGETFPIVVLDEMTHVIAPKQLLAIFHALCLVSSVSVSMLNNGQELFKEQFCNKHNELI